MDLTAQRLKYGHIIYSYEIIIRIMRYSLASFNKFRRHFLCG